MHKPTIITQFFDNLLGTQIFCGGTDIDNLCDPPKKLNIKSFQQLLIKSNIRPTLVETV
jgi:hypothetical protein